MLIVVVAPQRSILAGENVLARDKRGGAETVPSTAGAGRGLEYREDCGGRLDDVWPLGTLRSSRGVTRWITFEQPNVPVLTADRAAATRSTSAAPTGGAAGSRVAIAPGRSP